MCQSISRHLLLVCLAARLSLAVEPGHFRWFANIGDVEKLHESLVAFELTSDVYAGVHDEFADLRIFDDQDEEVPCLIQPKTQPRKRIRQNQCPLEIVEFNERADNVFEIVLARNDHPAPARLVVDTPLKNFEKRVSILGADINGDWRPLIVDEPIFDYTRFIDVRETTVNFPARPYALYMVRVDNVTDIEGSASVEITREIKDEAIAESARGILRRRDFRIDRLRFYSFTSETVATAPVRREYSATSLSVVEQPREKRTVVEFFTNGEPLLEVGIETDSRNFQRPVVLQMRGIRAPTGWQTLAKGHFSELSLGMRTRRELALELAEARGNHYRLLIENGDSPPVSIDDVRLIGTVDRVTFIANPDRLHKLYFGNDRLAPPRYDLAAVVDGLGDEAKPLTVKLGGVAPNPRFDGGVFSGGGFLASRAALIGAGSLIVIVLGWAIFYSAKKIDLSGPDS